jgi:hypothetical protein
LRADEQTSKFFLAKSRRGGRVLPGLLQPTGSLQACLCNHDIDIDAMNIDLKNLAGPSARREWREASRMRETLFYPVS